ncbi:hypothetical protein A2U01_0096436, partial [Trifolium medium]|nr:hypothetical protein [Trifolium medium]
LLSKEYPRKANVLKPPLKNPVYKSEEQTLEAVGRL